VGRWGLLAALVVAGSCSFDAEFRCEGDDQCVLRSGGACEGDGWCSYPSDDCEGGRVYGPYAPPSVADVCVGAPAETDAGSSSTSGDATTSGDGSSESSGGPQPACGNGIVEDGESCDDGNVDPGDACHPLCVEPYETVWTQEYNEADREDRGFAVDVDPGRDAIYVAGLTETADGSSADLLVQRYGLTDGARVWTFSRDAAGGKDTAEQVVVDSKGDVVVGGVETDATGLEHAWVAKFDPGGELVWELDDPMGSKAEGVAIADAPAESDEPARLQDDVETEIERPPEADVVAVDVADVERYMTPAIRAQDHVAALPAPSDERPDGNRDHGILSDTQPRPGPPHHVDFGAFDSSRQEARYIDAT